MALETLELNALGSNVDGSNPGVPLVLMSASANYYVTAFSSPAPGPKMQWAGSVDTEGARRADSSTYENRTVTLTVETKDTSSSSTHLDALTAAVTTIHRDGGTLKWTRKDGAVRIFDLLASDGYSATIDVKYEQGRAEVQLSFMALPYLRVAEIDLGDNSTTTLPWLIFTEASVPGDVPALGRLVIDNDAGATEQSVAIWGVQSRYYDIAATAALFYEAESCALLVGGSLAVGAAGASGAGSNVVTNTALPTSLTGLMYIGTSATAQTHVGTFRVLARVYAPSTNTGIVSVAASWRSNIGAPETFNASVPITRDGVPYENAWALVDLGEVQANLAKGSTKGWSGRIYVSSTVSGDDVQIDYVVLLPVTESSGMVSSDGITGFVPASGQLSVHHDGVWVSQPGGYWTRPQRFIGDYLLIPPSGPEARTARVMVKMAAKVVVDAGHPVEFPVVPDPQIDDISARLFVTPRYLT